MKILIVGLKTNPQALRMQEEAQKRGHELDACLSSDLVIRAKEDEFLPIIPGLDLASYDLIYLWTVSKRRWEWFTTALYLHKNHGTVIINQKVVDPTYHYFLSPAMDYWKQVDSSLPFPKSAVVLSHKGVDAVSSDFSYPAIVKAYPSSKGQGVYKVKSGDEIKRVLDATAEESLTWVIRELIPNDGDIRIFTVGYKAIGAMKRSPKEGDFRSNISQGGHGEPYDLAKNPKIKELAEKMSELTKTEIAGVDIMIHKETGDPYILEINPGPQFLGLEEFTKVNAAEEIVKYFESFKK